MAASNYTITIEQGTTTDFEVQYNDSTGSPVDLTGYEAKMDIRTDYLDNSGTHILTLSSSIGDVYAKASGSNFLSLSGSDLITPCTSGSIGVYVGHAQTHALANDTYYYDLELTKGQARIRLLEGLVIIKKQVTD